MLRLRFSMLLLVVFILSNHSVYSQIPSTDIFGDTMLLGDNFINSPMDIVATDVDNDGDFDIVSGLTNGLYKVSLHINNGDGSFQNPVIIDNNPGFSSDIHAADIDGDGFVDIFSVEQSSLKLYKSLGNGSFGLPITITINLNFGQSLFVEDLNNDTYLDVLTASSFDNMIAYHLNDGEGNFGEQIVISTTETYATSVFASDLDNDGDKDVLASSLSNGSITWYENDGQGAFSTGILISDAIQAATQVISADLDSDGDYDVIATSNTYKGVVLIENLGEGTFNIPITISNSVSFSKDLIASDINNDGNLDIAFVAAFDDGVVWIPNHGDLEFGEQINIDFKIRQAESIIAADFNKDGRIDLATATPRTDDITWYQNLTDSTFSEAKNIAKSSNSVPTVFLVDDFDNSGSLDIIVSNYDSENTLIYSNNGNGEFDDPILIADEFAVLEQFQFDDIDGDTLKDLIAIGRYSVNEQLQDLVWIKNKDNSTFDTITTIASFNTTALFDLADLDNDGDIDIVTVSNENNRLAWYQNIDGAIGNEMVISDNLSLESDLRIFDANNDDELDIVIYSFQDAVMKVFLNEGDANYSDTPNIVVSNIDVIDYEFTYLDNDQHLDIIVAGVENVRIYEIVDENVGEPILIPSLDFIRLTDISIEDFDKDGDTDIIGVYNYAGVVLIRNTNGIFGNMESVNLDFEKQSEYSISANDINNDSYPDIVFISPFFDEVAWIPNAIPIINSNETTDDTLPTDLNLSQNYPNPFNPSTKINYQIPEASLVKIQVFDLLGREVSTLVDSKQNAGNHSITFNATGLSSGVYIYQITANGFTITKKFSLIK